MNDFIYCRVNILKDVMKTSISLFRNWVLEQMTWHVVQKIKFSLEGVFTKWYWTSSYPWNCSNLQKTVLINFSNLVHFNPEENLSLDS